MPIADESNLPNENNPRKEQRASFGIIHRSPIEFVLVGPKGRDHGILARSKEAQIDLIGFSASDRDRLDVSDSGILARIFFSYPFAGTRAIKMRVMNAVTSRPAESTQPEFDPRRQTYRFCWVGHCTDDERDSIRMILNRQLPDIERAMKRKDAAGAEWALSPIILECSLGINRHLGRLIPYRAAIVFYSLGLVMTALVVGVMYLANLLYNR